MQFVTATESIQAYLLHEFASLKLLFFFFLDNMLLLQISFFLKHKQQGNKWLKIFGFNFKRKMLSISFRLERFLKSQSDDYRQFFGL